MTDEEPKKSKRKWEPELEDNSLTPWVWAGMSFEQYDRLPVSARRWWGERWRARCEAKWRANGRPIKPSHFAPEELDDVLTRLGMDRYGGLLDADPLGLSGPKYVEDHTPPDTRPWDIIASEAGLRLRDRLDAILERNAQRRQRQT